MEKKRRLKDKYNSNVESYEKRYREIQSRKFNAIQKYIDNSSNLLEVGCGTGFFLEDFSNFSDQVFAADLSFEMLKKAKKRFSDAFFVLADADNLPFDDRVFDTVVSLTLLQNMPDPRHTVEEMARVLKEGGDLIATILDKEFSQNEISGWLESTGLKTKKIENIANSEDLLLVAERKL